MTNEFLIPKILTIFNLPKKFKFELNMKMPLTPQQTQVFMKMMQRSEEGEISLLTNSQVQLMEKDLKLFQSLGTKLGHLSMESSALTKVIQLKQELPQTKSLQIAGDCDIMAMEELISAVNKGQITEELCFNLSATVSY